MASSAAEDGEDDYMTMPIPEDPVPKHESSIQRRARKQREAEQRAHPKSKSQLDREAREARETALSSSILVSNPGNQGAKILAKLGYTSGPLGAGGNENARTEPISLVMKEDRSGLGHESEAKRKFREEAEALKLDMKKRRVDEDEFQQRVSIERKEKRIEGQILGAMKVAERLDETEKGASQAESPTSRDGSKHKAIQRLPVVWRGLVKERMQREHEDRARLMLRASLPQSRLPKFEDPDEDHDDKLALGIEDKFSVQEEELEETDSELDEFNALEPDNRLNQLIDHLRKAHQYCFWCKCQYPDKAMTGCPGLTEEEHD